MQLERLMLMLLIIIVMPVMILTSNHNIFFVLIGLVTLFFSFSNIYGLFKKEEYNDESEDDLEELDSAFGLDIEKFGRGIEFVKSLILVVFFIYCAMFLKSGYLKILPASLISYRLMEVAESLFPGKREHEDSDNVILRKIIAFGINAACIALILLVAYDKFLYSSF